MASPWHSSRWCFSRPSSPCQQWMALRGSCKKPTSSSSRSDAIIGLGEAKDRIGLLHTLATLPTHSESVPINEGTPLEDQKVFHTTNYFLYSLDGCSCCAILHHIHGKSIYVFVIRFSILEQVLCFLPETNSIFASKKLLTVANNNSDTDQTMFKILGLIPNVVCDSIYDNKIVTSHTITCY